MSTRRTRIAREPSKRRLAFGCSALAASVWLTAAVGCGDDDAASKKEPNVGVAVPSEPFDSSDFLDGGPDAGARRDGGTNPNNPKASGGGRGGRGGTGGVAGSAGATASAGASASAGAEENAESNPSTAGSGRNDAVPLDYTPMQFVEMNECRACQQHWRACDTRRSECLNGQGTATAGPKAGAREADLCKDTLACLYNTNCADSKADPLACLCGEGVPLDQCVSTGAVGKCASELQAAAETTAALDISVRLGDPTFAAGLAFRTLLCAERYCAKSCGLCAAADPMCADADLGTELPP